MRKTPCPSALPARPGLSLAELLLVIFLATVLLVAMLVAVNPGKWLYENRNTNRKSDLSGIATAVSEYINNENASLLLAVPAPPDDAVEICADVLTGSCTNLLNLNPLIGAYLDSIPMDPKLKNKDAQNEHSGYFIIRSAANRFTISAPLAERGAVIEVTM